MPVLAESEGIATLTVPPCAVAAAVKPAVPGEPDTVMAPPVYCTSPGSWTCTVSPLIASPAVAGAGLRVTR